MEKTIKFRAHHLLCIPRFYSGGYNKEFAINMKRIVQSIRATPYQKVKVVIGKGDDLCFSCPHWHKNRCIQGLKMEKWVIIQDKKIAKYLKLKPNTISKAKDIFNLSMEKANNKRIRDVCEGCVFLKNCIKVGINNSFKKDLNK